MRRFFAAMLGIPVGFLVFAFAGYWAIVLFSGNAFDRSVEASVTALILIGPAGAVIGLITGFMLGGARRDSAPSQPLE